MSSTHESLDFLIALSYESADSEDYARACGLLSAVFSAIPRLPEAVREEVAAQATGRVEGLVDDLPDRGTAARIVHLAESEHWDAVAAELVVAANLPWY